MDLILIAITGFAFVAILSVICMVLGKCYDTEQNSDFYGELRGENHGRTDEFE